MSFAQMSGYILLVLMILLTFETTKFVSGARFNGRGIYFITVNAWFRGHKGYLNWLRNNRIYHWCILLIIALCPTILLLIRPFSQGHMLIRDELSPYFNVMLWFALCFVLRIFYNRK